MYSIGVDIGGSHITAAVYDLGARKLRHETVVHQKVDTRGERDEIVGLWSKTITACRVRSGMETRGVGIAMPGPFNYYDGISLIQGVDKMESLYKVNIRETLADRLNIAPDQIRFINDAAAFSIAEARIGYAANFKRMVAITLGTGFGSSFLENGKPVISDHRVPRGGCLFHLHWKNQLADDVFSGRGIIGRYNRLSGKEAQNVREIFERAADDRFAKDTFQEFGKELGEFLNPFLKTFDAEVLVIGGNIGKAFSLFGSELKHQIPDVEVYVSSLGEEAAMIGGAMLLDDDYYTAIVPTIKLMNFE